MYKGLLIHCGELLCAFPFLLSNRAEVCGWVCVLALPLTKRYAGESRGRFFDWPTKEVALCIHAVREGREGGEGRGVYVIKPVNPGVGHRLLSLVSNVVLML